MTPCTGLCMQGLLQAFIDYITDRKTVHLEDLASEFGLRVQVRSQDTMPPDLPEYTYLLSRMGTEVFLLTVLTTHCAGCYQQSADTGGGRPHNRCYG